MLGEAAVSRVVTVVAGSPLGSGYLIAADLVLTAGNVVLGRDAVRVESPHSGEATDAEVVWRSPSVDAALLRTNVPLLPAGEDLEPMWGRTTPQSEGMAWTALWAPPWQRDAVTMVVDGNLLQRERVSHDELRLAVDTPSPMPDAGSSWWAGLSGTAVFADDLLVGIVTKRHRQLPRLIAVAADSLVDLPGFTEALGRTPRLVPLNPDRAFEIRYFEHLQDQYGSTTVQGYGLPGPPRAVPLDALAGPSITRTGDAVTPPLRVEELLKDHDRVLLLGEAGSGKTTALHRLALSVAAGQLRASGGGDLDRVPFVLPARLVRDGRLPLPKEFLSVTGSPLSDLEPERWAASVMSSARGLLLVDGIDEVNDERSQWQLRASLTDRLNSYPDTLCVVTARPSAVDLDWLHDLGFDSYTIQAMDGPAVVDFVRKWHGAVRSVVGSEAERASVTRRETELVEAVRTKPDLRRFAGTALLAGLMCAIHLERQGRLASGGRELYDAALSMLLVRRDEERELYADLHLDQREQIQIFQQLAYWMVRNGVAEASHERAVQLIREVWRPQTPFATDFSATKFTQLQARSGLLRERAPGRVEFANSAFRDYLAAHAAVEAGDLGLLVGNAHDERWGDVFRFAVARARRGDREELFRGLLGRISREPEPATRLLVLALTALEQVTELSPDIREELEQRARQLLPPETQDQIEALAGAGPAVASLLPGPDDLSQSQAAGIVALLHRIGGPESEALAERYVPVARPRPAPPAWHSREPAPPPSAARKLAVALSTASRIEPELMRAVRLHVLPYLDVGAESDLWFSDWVASRTPAVIALRPELLPELRGELAEKVAGAAEDDPVHALGELISRVHEDISPALALEERIAWADVTGDPDGMDRMLEPALRALVAERREGIADWLAGAWERLPEAARRTATGWQLATVSARRAELEPGDVPVELDIRHAGQIAAALPDVPLPVALRGDGLVLGEGDVAVPVPDTDPRVVDVLVDGEVHPATVRAGGTATVPAAGGGAVRIRTARGATYTLRGDDRPPSTPTGDSGAGSLPPAVRDFQGRERELSQLLDWLDEASSDSMPVLAVTGLPGSGKTALAVRAAGIARDRAWFPGGVLFAGMRRPDGTPLGAEAVLTRALLPALGVDQARLPASADQLLTRYRSLLAERPRMLIVLDDGDAVDRIRPLVPGVRHRVLVTSHRTMGEPSIRELALSRLSPAEAVAVLTAAGVAGAGARAMDLELVAQACDGVPLALLLAAAWVPGPGQSFNDLILELYDRPSRVRVLSELHTAYASAYRHLPEGEGWLLRQLARAPVVEYTAETAAALTRQDPAPTDQFLTDRLLRNLAGTFFIEGTGREGRWIVPELVRDFATTSADPRQAPNILDLTAQERLAEHYADRLEAAADRIDGRARTDSPFPSPDSVVPWLRDESANFLAVAHARTSERLNRALESVVAALEAATGHEDLARELRRRM